MILGKKFEVPHRYKILDAIGSGAYGLVVAAEDQEIEVKPAKEGDDDDDDDEGEQSNLVAIKLIRKCFEHKVYALRTYRELKIMRLLSHENVLPLNNLLIAANNEDIFVVTPLMEADLGHIVKST